MTITGATRLYAILGDPLHKARTPERFNALFAERGIDAVMVPAEVDVAGFDAAVEGFKRLRNCHGLIVTMPHKQSMLKHLDVVHENGRLIGAVNAIERLADGRWAGDMFDGRGYVGALHRHGVALEGKRVHMIGAGAVARAMAFALVQAGIAAITLRDVERCRAEDLAAALQRAYPGLRAEAVDDDRYDCDLLANATPLGLMDGDAMPCEVRRIARGTMVTDVIPKPEITPLLAAAKERGCRISTGRDMVEAQIEFIAEFLGLRG
jgi:shikimate dehydrogenase